MMIPSRLTRTTPTLDPLGLDDSSMYIFQVLFELKGGFDISFDNSIASGSVSSLGMVYSTKKSTNI